MAATLTKVIDAPAELGFFAILDGLGRRWGLSRDEQQTIDARLRDAMDDERSERFSVPAEPKLAIHHQIWHLNGFPYRTDYRRVEVETLAKSPEGLRLRVVWDVEDCDGVMGSTELLQIEVSAAGGNAETELEAFEDWLFSLDSARVQPRIRQASAAC